MIRVALIRLAVWYVGKVRMLVFHLMVITGFRSRLMMRYHRRLSDLWFRLMEIGIELMTKDKRDM